MKTSNTGKDKLQLYDSKLSGSQAFKMDISLSRNEVKTGKVDIET